MPIVPINIKVTEDADYYITAEMDAQIYSRILPDGIVHGVGHNCDMTASQEKIVIQSGLICTQGYLMTVKNTVELPYLPTDGKVYVKARLDLGGQTDEWSIRLYNNATETKEDLFKGGRTREVLLATVQGTTVTKHNLIKPLVDDMDTVRQLNERVKQAEDARVSAESGRVQAEAGRVRVETQRVSSEDQRKQQESQRTQAETARAQKEQARETKEAQRQQAEQTRATQETTRVSKETERQQKETARQQAEQSRASAESDRARADQERRTWFNQSKTAFDNSDIGRVSNRITAVEQASATAISAFKQEIGQTIQTAKTDLNSQITPVLTKISALEREEKVNDVSVDNHVLRIRKGSKVSEVALPKNESIIAYQLANQLVNPDNQRSFTLALNTKKGLGKALIVLKGDDPDAPQAANQNLLQVETFADLNRLGSNLLTFLAPVAGYQNWKTMLISNFEILDLYLKNVTTVPNDVKQYLTTEMNKSSVLYQFIAEHPNVSKLMTGTPINFGVINRLKDYVTVVENSSTLSQLVNDTNSVNYIATNSPAMQAVLASDKAMQAVLASDKAMQAVAASDKAMQAVLASDKHRATLIKHNSILQSIAKTLYQTVSRSPLWEKKLALTNKDSWSLYWSSYGNRPDMLLFANVGAYGDSSAMTRITHTDGSEAGRDSLSNVYSLKQLNLDRLIVSFKGASGYSVSGDDSYAYEIWAPK